MQVGIRRSGNERVTELSVTAQCRREARGDRGIDMFVGKDFFEHSGHKWPLGMGASLCIHCGLPYEDFAACKTTKSCEACLMEPRNSDGVTITGPKS
jgi:hypothetical protein